MLGSIRGLVFCTLFLTLSANAQNTFPSTGNVGIGTSSPTTSLDVNGTLRVVGGAVPSYAYGVAAMGAPGAPRGILIAGEGGFSNGFMVQYTGSAMQYSFIDGNVGIGTTTPAYTLDVNGIANASGGIRFPDGNVQTVAYMGTTCGADYAEAVEVTGDRTKYEPGDILVIDPDAPGKFLKSNQPYSTLVSGIYSTKPGFVGRLQPLDLKTRDEEVPMAMVGRVPTKVSAENGPIKVGDLLVASSTVGRAMKGTDRNRMLGAVIGKALAPLTSGTGVIEVLVTLQ